VESFDITEFYDSNFAQIGRPTAILNQGEAQREATLMYSEFYVPNSDINNLNRVYPDVNFEEYNKSFGSIVYLHNEDDHLLMIQKDKTSKVYVDKSVIFDAQGNAQLLGTQQQILSDSIPYAGEYGIYDATTFRAFGNSRYWLDAERGVVLRLSINGIEEISRYGMKGWFAAECRSLFGQSDTNVYSIYDVYNGLYIIHFAGSGNVLAFNEANNAWTHFITFYSPKFSEYINNRAFYTSNEQLIEINKSGVNRNAVYQDSAQGASETSVIKFVSNIEPSELKNYLALVMDSNKATDVTITTEAIGGGTDQSSTLDADLDFIQRETEWHAAFLRDSNTPNVSNPLLEGDTIKGKEAIITLTLPAAEATDEFWIKLIKVIVSRG